MEAKDWKVGDIVRPTYKHSSTGGRILTRERTEKDGWWFKLLNEDREHGWDFYCAMEFVRRPEPESFIGYPAETICTDGGAHEKDCKYAPKIEQKPICTCCSQATFGNDWRGSKTIGIFHDDPCQYTSDERNMLPLAKKMFRESMKRRIETEKAHEQRESNLDRMEDIEWDMSATMNPSYSDVKEYLKLTTENT